MMMTKYINVTLQPPQNPIVVPKPSIEVRGKVPIKQWIQALWSLQALAVVATF